MLQKEADRLTLHRLGRVETLRRRPWAQRDEDLITFGSLCVSVVQSARAEVRSHSTALRFSSPVENLSQLSVATAAHNRRTYGPTAGHAPRPIRSPVPHRCWGMGEVDRARDTRLDRAVAVKVLAPELADDAEFRARFARDAKAISALNRPHICGLCDIGHEHNTEWEIYVAAFPTFTSKRQISSGGGFSRNGAEMVENCSTSVRTVR